MPPVPQPDAKRLVTETTVKRSALGSWADTALAAVVDSVGRSWVRYMPDGTVEVAKAKVTSLFTVLGAPVTSVTPSWLHPYIAAVADSVGRAAVGILPDGTVEAFKVTVNNLLTLPGGGLVKPVTGNIFDDTWTIADAAGHAWLVGKKDGKVTISLAADSRIPDSLLANSEQVTARGSRTTLNARLSSGLDTYGFTKDYLALPQHLRWTRMLTRRLIYGDAATQLDIAVIGDSYSQNASRWTGIFWSALKNLYGDAGVGWVGFSNPSSVPLQNGSVRADTTLLLTGTWTPNYYGTHSPDLGEVASSTAGNTVLVTFPAGATSAKLFFIGGAAGSEITYAWNGNGAGAATLSLVAGATLQTAVLAGIGSTSTTLTLTVTGGTVTLCGVDLRNAGNGIRVHKIAATGSSSSNYAAVNAASWQAGIAALAPRVVIVMLGTNDQGASRTPAAFAANITTIFANLDAALGHTAYDAVIAVAEENQRGLAVTMASYAEALKPVAEAITAAFVDLQPLFGVAPADYAFGSSRPWHVADNVHPDPATGGRVIADAVLRLFVGR